MREETTELRIVSCPQCEGEGGYPDGLDEAACHTVCTRCAGNGFIVDPSLLADLEAAEARVGVLGKLLSRSGAYMQPPREAHHRFAEDWRDARQTYDTLLAETRTALANPTEDQP